MSQMVEGVEQQITLTCPLCAGVWGLERRCSINLAAHEAKRSSQVSTSLGASNEFISRKRVACGVRCVCVCEGNCGGCEVAAIFNRTGSHKNDVKPVRNAV